MVLDEGMGKGYTVNDRRFHEFRDKYNIIQKDNIVDDGNIKFFIINRPDLDDIIRIAYMIQNQDTANVENIFADKDTRRKLHFYELDMDALNKIQVDYNFIIGSTSGLDKSGSSITYKGIIFEDNLPTNKQAHLIINDLDRHFSSIRFAFSAYQVMQRNNERYSMVLKNKGMIHDSKTIMFLDKYFEQSLKDYLNNR